MSVATAQRSIAAFKVMATTVLWLCLAGCVSAPSSDQTGLPRLDAVPRQTLIIPMDDSWSADVGEEFTVRFDTGESARGMVKQLSVRVEADPTLERAARWLPPPGLWSSQEQGDAPAGRADELRGVVRVIAVELPDSREDGPRSRVLRVAGRDFALQVLPSPFEYTPRITTVSEVIPSDPWEPTFGSAGAVSPVLSTLAWPEALSPIGRWRYRLLTGTLRPEQDPPPFNIFAPVGDPSTRGVGGLQSFDDDVVEALARQYEGRWRVALAKLWATDQDLAMRVKRRLAAVVDFGNGYVSPAWPTDQGSMERLLADLLNPDLDGVQRTWRAEAWLNLQPAAIAWVVDDSGTLDVLTGRGVGTASVANLSDVSTLAWVSTNDAETKDLRSLPAYSSARLVVEPSRVEPPLAARVGLNEAGSTRPGAMRVATIHAGKWSERVSLVEGRVAAKPPNFQIGPLLPDFTMATWLDTSAPSAARSETLTAAMLHNVDGRWEIFIECLAPAAEQVPAQDVVRLWIGPLGSPLSVLRIDGRGVVSDEARRADLVATPGDVRVGRTADRWSFRITLPDRCIEPDGLLRLGITRTDAAGSRSSWPRPMMPWQEEPGRLAIDTAAWKN